MLTAFADSERVFAALKAGAVGYLLKNVRPDEIRATVERAAAGEPMLSGEIAGRVLREFERERQEERLPRAARRAHRARGGDPEAARDRRVEPGDRASASSSASRR